MLGRLRQRLLRFVDDPPPAGVAASALFGIVAPVACILVDEREGFGISSSSLWFVWALEASALALWLSRRARSRAVTALLGGTLLAGAGVGVLFGALTVPFAVFFVAGGALRLDGELVGLGLFGFLPPACALVFVAASWGALRSTLRTSGDPPAVLLVLLGLLVPPGLALGAAHVLERAADRCTLAIARGERHDAERILRRMGPLARFADWNDLAGGGAFGRVPDGAGDWIAVEDRAHAIATWERVTGREHDHWIGRSD